MVDNNLEEGCNSTRWFPFLPNIKSLIRSEMKSNPSSRNKQPLDTRKANKADDHQFLHLTSPLTHNTTSLHSHLQSPGNCNNFYVSIVHSSGRRVCCSAALTPQASKQTTHTQSIYLPIAMMANNEPTVWSATTPQTFSQSQLLHRQLVTTKTLKLHP